MNTVKKINNMEVIKAYVEKTTGRKVNRMSLDGDTVKIFLEAEVRSVTIDFKLSKEDKKL